MGAQNIVDIKFTNALVAILLGERADDSELVNYLISCNGSCIDNILRKFATDDSDVDYLKKVSKILAELNPENKSRFEEMLIRDLLDIDIFKGVKGLDNLSAAPGEYDSDDNVDATIDVEEVNRNCSSDNGIHASNVETRVVGIDFVKSRIVHYLVDTGFAKNILVEYSLLSSTLEPTNPDKLQCVSFIIGDDAFKKKVNTYYTESIRKTNEHGISVYQHPHFLYNIGLDKENYKLIKADDGVETSTWADGQGVTGTVKCDDVDQTVTDKYRISTNHQEYKYGTYRMIGGMYVDAFKLDRSFNEMLREAKKLDGVCRPLVDVQNTLHSFCHRNISKIRGKKSAYISFPVYGSRASNQLPQYEIIRADNKKALQGIGAFFIYFEPEVDMSNSSNQKLLMAVLSKIAYEMGNFIRFISANYMFNLGLQLQENARREALKSAKSAIMSRNMSHNLGSHVMSYLKQNLSSVQSVLNDRILALLFENEADMFANLSVELKNAINSKETEKGALPFLVGLGQFISYLQERQDFIATIATDFIPYLSTVNFKDFIYDELNPDKRYERHKDRKNYKIDNILLGNIARSEGLGRPTSPTITLSKDGKETPESKLNDIVIKFRSFDGNPVKDPSGNISNPRGNDALLHMRDYDLSLPGGVVGRQAIFSIVENTIRNAAKHGNWREKGKLELTFDVYTKDELLTYRDYIRQKHEVEQNGGETEELKRQEEKLEASHQGICSSLDDNSNGLSLWEVFDKFYLDAKDSRDLYFVTLTDNLSTDAAKLEKLRMAIKEPLVNERGEMNEASKGIKEMRISSSWLRGLSESEVYNPIEYEEKNCTKLKSEEDWNKTEMDQNAPSLYARISKQQDGNHLQYIFCILRPKKVAIISSKFPRESESQDDNSDKLYNKEAFLRNSWSAFHPIDYINEKNKSFEFVIYDEGADINDSWWLDLRYVSSLRLMKLSDIPELKTDLFDKIKIPSGNGEKDLEAEKKLYDGMLGSLYHHVSHYSENEDHILIDDPKTDARKNSEREFRPFEAITIIDGHQENQEVNTRNGNWNIYRSHHESAGEYKKFMDEQDGKVFEHGVYVEGITGNNSTDRLIRNENLNEGWFYRHLHAMKEKIAIFDERIFTKIYGLEEADLNVAKKPQVKIKDLSKRYFSTHNLNTIQEQEDWKRENVGWQQIIKREYQDEFPDVIDSRDKAKAKTEYIPTANSQKGIYVFTIVRDPLLPSIFNLYGLESSLEELDDDNLEDKYTSICKKIAKMSWDEDGLRIDWVGENEETFYKNMFDRISIHQGLLDKLYTVFEIKDKSELKEKLTNKFYMEFSVNQEDEREREVVIEQEADKLPRVKRVDSLSECQDRAGDRKIVSIHPFYLLPGMCIHSGRSKPGENDMPQHIPFIQYAAIENAVSDCKYSLVELLDYARYERERK